MSAAAEDGMFVGIDYGGTATKVILAPASELRALSLPPADGERPGASGGSGSGRSAGLRGAGAIQQFTIPTPKGADALEVLAREVMTMLDGAGVESVGITIPGVVDEVTGVVHRSTNLPWLDAVDVNARVTALIGAPARAVHDGRAAAQAEAVFGAGRAHSDVFVVAIGTGVAGAHIVDGEARRGIHGGAGEVGHITQDVDGDLCNCGQRGCLETFVAGAHLARRWRAHGHGPDATARDLLEAAGRGDRAALSIVEQATDALAHGLLGVVATLDPGLIVLGGGVSQARELIVDRTIEKVHEWATFHQLPKIVPASLGVWAGAWGAVIAAQSTLESLDAAEVRAVPVS